MSFRLAAAYGAAAVLSACAGPQQTPTVKLPVDLTAAEVAWSQVPGRNTIKGNAFMRQRGGGVVTCAGQDVALIPVSEYSERRMLVLYGNTSGGMGVHRAAVVFEPNPPAYHQTIQRTKCDAQGNFIFEGLADGSYFAALQISWMAGQSTEGGNLMQRFDVKGGQTVSKVLAP